MALSGVPHGAEFVKSLPISLLETIPAATPPRGKSSNLVNPHDAGPGIVAGASVIIGLAYLMVLVRLYAKTRLLRKVTWDDLTLGLGVACGTVFFAGTARANTKGPWGIHQWSVSAADLLSTSNTIVPNFLAAAFSSPSLGLVKLTLFLFQYSIFWPLKWFRWCIWVGGTISTMFYTGMAIAQIICFSPSPHQSWLDAWLSPKLLTEERLNVPVGSVGLVIDVYLFVLPLIAVYQRHMQKNQKLRLSLMFSFGALGCVASALSIYYRAKSSAIEDNTGTTCYAELVCIAEVFIGVIIACMPSLSKVIYEHRHPSSRGSGSSGASPGSRLKSSLSHVQLVVMNFGRGEKSVTEEKVGSGHEFRGSGDDVV